MASSNNLMMKYNCMGFAGMIMVVALLIQSAAAQTVHVVGDNLGWTVPQNGASAYSNWAATKSFMVGDILVFNFTTNEHDVLQVQKASFDACSDDNPIGNVITNGPANVTLNSAGQQYYICTIGRHCQFGQKLAITVSAASDSPNLPPPTPPTTPTTPSPSGTPADCTPEPTPGPTGGSSSPGPNPNGSSTNTPTPTSSSSAVFAGLLLPILALLLSWA